MIDKHCSKLTKFLNIYGNKCILLNTNINNRNF